MPRLKWFLIGIALTAFFADYIHLKVHHRESEVLASQAVDTAEKFRTVSSACMVELAYRKSMIESWSEKTKIITMAQTETLSAIDRAREGDAEAILALRDLGYSVSNQKKLIAVRYGIGGPLVEPSHR